MKINKCTRILIIANGQINSAKLLNAFARRADCIIAADGGSLICYRKQIYPHFIVGDLDSVDENVLDYFRTRDTEIIHIPDQNRHDLDKALGFALTLKPAVIDVLGAFGKRLDHSLANLVFIQSQTFDIPLQFVDDYGRLSYIHGVYELDLPAGSTVSLFSFLPVAGLSLEGFEYPLHDMDFPDGFNGLSNKTIKIKSKISVRQGSLFLYCLHEDTST